MFKRTRLFFKNLISDKLAGIFIIYVFLQTSILLFSLIFGLNTLYRFYNIELSIDIFGDFANVLRILHLFENPYATGNRMVDLSYPPFALLFYMPYLVFYNMQFTNQYIPQALGLLFFMSVPLYFICRLLLKKIADSGINHKVLFLISLTLTLPLMFLMLRSNVLLYSFMFVLFFLEYYNSPVKFKRELSFVALASACAIKFYPLVFCLLLLIKGRLYDIVKTVIYFAVISILPFLIFKGGFSNIDNFLANMGNFSGTVQDFSLIKTDNYSLNTLLQFISLPFNGWKPMNTLNLKNIMAVALIICVVIFSFRLEKSWKVITLLALCITFVPSISYIYTQVFFIAAFLEFLSEKNRTKKDYIYFVLFLLILMPFNRFFFSYEFPKMNLDISFPWYYNNPDVWFSDGWKPIESPLNTLIAVLAMAVMLILISIDSIREYAAFIKEYGFKSCVKGIIHRIFTKPLP